MKKRAFGWNVFGRARCLNRPRPARRAGPTCFGWILALSIGCSTVAFASVGDYQTLHEFAPSENNGSRPVAAPIESGGYLYGMTPYGGFTNWGVVYSLRLSDNQYTNLHVFSGLNGRLPLGSPLLYNGMLYGMTCLGGTNNDGVIFRMATNGTGFTVLHHFDDRNENDGAGPWGSLIETNGILYGMTYNGGLTNRGVIFSILPNGTGYTNLHRFVGGAGDGKHPKSDLIADEGVLYGLANEGGSNNAGVVFRMAVDGSGYSNLYEFTSKPGNGLNPYGKLVKDGTSLFGTVGPVNGNAGSVFYLSTEGGDATFIHTFSAGANDGGVPEGGLIRKDEKLYGLTRYGGAHSKGVLCALGVSYSNQYMWASGGEPVGELLAVGNVFYGTTLRGGAEDYGTLFRFEPDPSNPGGSAWCAMTWIDGGGMGTTVAGDENWARAYIRHSVNMGLPDQAYFGYGRTQNADDETWTWIPMSGYGLVNGGSDYEFTGRVSRASPGQYYVAAKFIKGTHVYYNPSTMGSWGDWNTQLYSANAWTVTPLAAPSNALARFVDEHQVDLEYQGDGMHWVIIFRKTGDPVEFAPPADSVAYYQGSTYADQGECIYRGGANGFSNTNLTSNTVFHYQLFTENNSFYSTGVVLSASTNPNRDDDGDQMQNAWELRYNFNPGDSLDGSMDEDNDHSLNWEEFVAGTVPTNEASVFTIEDNVTMTPSVCVFSWSSEAGKFYTIWSATNLTQGTRTAVASHLPATPPVNTYTNPVAGDGATIYSVEVEH
jgi:uncharacterized repeat protein (TIGR03803 family)